MLAVLLRGFKEQVDFKSLVIENNEVDKEGIPEIINLIHRPFPRHLEELRIINCKIHTPSLVLLLQTLKEKTYLKQLGLVNLNFREIGIPFINDIIQNNRYLRELDLSWNDLRP